MKSKTAQLLRYLAAFVAGTIAGAALLFFFSTRPLLEMLSLVTVSQSDDRAYVLYRYGNYRAAQTAVLRHIRLAESLAREQKLTLGKGSSGDLMLWYGRLALAAEKAGNVEDASGYWTRAIGIASSDGGKVTQAEVLDMVRAMDHRWDTDLAEAGS